MKNFQLLINKIVRFVNVGMLANVVKISAVILISSSSCSQKEGDQMSGLLLTQAIPASGPTIGGNRTVKIVGQGFTPDAQVFFAGKFAPITHFISSSEIEVALPPNPGAFGPVEIKVTLPLLDDSSSSASNSNIFSYYAGDVQFASPLIETILADSTTLSKEYSAFSTVSADFDGDGKLDVAAVGKRTGDSSNTRTGRLYIRFSSFQPQVFIQDLKSNYVVTLLAAGDVNQDGRADIVAVAHEERSSTGARSPDQISVLFSLQKDSLSMKDLPQLSENSISNPFNFLISSVHVVDINQDGILDLVTSAKDSNHFDVFPGTLGADKTYQLNNPISTSFGKAGSTVSMVNPITISGKPSIVAINRAEGSLQVFRSKENFSFDPLLVSPLPTSLKSSGNPMPTASVVGDFNGDDLMDIAVANRGTQDVIVFLQTAQGGFEGKWSYATSNGMPMSLISGDFNGDHKSDLLVVNQNLVGSAWVENFIVFLQQDNGFNASTPFRYSTSVSPAGSLSDIPYPQSATSLDINQDGKLDLAIVEPRGLFVVLPNISL